MAEHVCPVWMGYLLANPLRRLVQNPDTILAPYIREGMTCLDAGCAMGFFSLPMARLTGPSGTVVCVDFQQKMLDALKRRAGRAGLLDRITTRCCTRESLCLDGLQDTVDFALTMAVIHEVPDPAFFFTELWETLKPGGRLLAAEPAYHIRKARFAEEVDLARNAGFTVLEYPAVAKSHAVLLEKQA